MYELKRDVLVEAVDALSDHYLGLGASSVSFVSSGIEGYMTMSLLSEDRDWFSRLGLNEVPLYLQASDWEYQYEKTIISEEVIEGVMVYSEFADSDVQLDADKLCLKMDFRGAFGDGAHPTTQLCARFLNALCQENHLTSLVDLGTGTGILAILAHIWGISDIAAYDYDAISVERARRNFVLNGVPHEVLQADVLVFQPQRTYDIVMANLHSALISEGVIQLKAWMNQDGFLVVSGISEQWRSDSLECFTQHGFVAVSEVSFKGWVGFVLKINDILHS